MTQRIFLWAVVLAALFIYFYFYPEVIAAFLKGPILPPPLRSSNRIHTPFEMQPIRDEIFSAFSRKQRQQLKKMRKQFKELQENGKLVPCQLDGGCSQKSSNPTFFAWLRGLTSHERILIYNPLPFHRYICGKVIWGNGGTLELGGSAAENCLSEGISYVHVASPPPTSGEGMAPIELFWNTISSGYDDAVAPEDYETEKFECPIPCQKAGEYSLLSTISVKDTPWTIFSTMEGEQYFSVAKVNSKAYQHDRFYAVTSFRSEIPVPYFSWAEYELQNPHVDFDKAIKGASFLANNCVSMSKRELLVAALMASPLRIDSLSGCQNNAQPPEGVDMSNKTAVLEKYLFHLAFENQRSDDYVTEKLWGTLESGTLPIYFGAKNIKEHVPPNSVVFVDDFATPQALADYLVKLSEDKALYESYHAWRYKPLDESFRRKYAFTHTHSTCRMCKWAYAKKHGFAWNHTTQEVEQPRIERKTCRNKMGLIGHPFKEFWLESTGKAASVESVDGSKSCTIDASNRVLLVDGGKVQRRAYNQDGITDIRISVTDGNYILQLETPIQSSTLDDVGSLGKEWRLQDKHTRMTILTDNAVEMSLPQESHVRIPVSSALRIRVIVEDVDTFHKGARKRANYFGELLKQDFFNPLQGYQIVNR